MAEIESKVTVWNQALGRIGHTRFVSDPDEETIEAQICRLHWDTVLREVLEQHDWSFARFEAALSSIASTTHTYDGTTTPSTNGSRTVFPIPTEFLDQGQLTVTLDGAAQTFGTHYTLTAPGAGALPVITMTTAPGAGTSLVIVVADSREGWTYLYSLPSNFVRATSVLWSGVRSDATPRMNRVQYAILPGPAGHSRILACNESASNIVLEYIGALDYPPSWPPTFLSTVAWRLAAELSGALSKDQQSHVHAWTMYRTTLAQARAHDLNKNRQSREPQLPSEGARQMGDYDNDWPPYRRPV